MIVDTLRNSDRYKLLHKNFATAIDFLQNNDLSKLPLGRTVVDGDNDCSGGNALSPRDSRNIFCHNSINNNLSESLTFNFIY